MSNDHLCYPDRFAGQFLSSFACPFIINPRLLVLGLGHSDYGLVKAFGHKCMQKLRKITQTIDHFFSNVCVVLA
jgi:hypothetical protein